MPGSTNSQVNTGVGVNSQINSGDGVNNVGPGSNHGVDNTPTIEELRKQRANVRRKITVTCKSIVTAIHHDASRGGIKALMQDVYGNFRQAVLLEDMLVGEPDFTKQYENHLYYTELVGKTKADVELYLGEDLEGSAFALSPVRARNPTSNDGRVLSRSGASSVASHLTAASIRQSHPSVNRDEEDDIEAVRRLLADNHIAHRAGSRSSSSAGHSRHSSPADRTGQWVKRLPRTGYNSSSSPPGEAPDDWIDLYSAGRLPPTTWTEKGARSSVRAELEVFSGKALDWFCWIDLFRALVHDTGKAPGEKLAILKRNLRDDCLNIVHGLGGGEAAYIEALVRLKQSVGRRDVMREAHLQALDRLDAGRGDAASLKRFAEKVRTHLFDLTQIGEASPAAIITKICRKLKLSDQQAWNAEPGFGIESRSLNEFGSWLCQRAATYLNAYNVAAEQLGQPPAQPPAQHQRHRDRQQARTNQSSTQPDTKGKDGRPATRPFCFRCEREHRLTDCPDFKLLPVAERAAFCNQRRLCAGCFGIRHALKDCRRAVQCPSSGCTERHHQLLHGASTPPFSAANPNVPSRSFSAYGQQRTVALGVLPLDALAADGSTVRVNVMIDEGSDTTLVREALAHRLKLVGLSKNLDVDGVGGKRTSVASQRVKLQLRSAFGELLQLEGSTMPVITRPVPVVEWEVLRNRWRHLADLPLRSSGGTVDILLGLDQAHLMAVIEARNGGEDEPFASRTRLGWVVRGVIDADTTPLAARIHTVFRSADEELLSHAVRRFCDTEEFGSEYQALALSPEEREAIEILDSRTQKLEVGYEVPITWKRGEPNLPNNLPLAEKRLHSLLRRFQREPDFERDYRAAMEKNFVKEYAVVVDDVKPGIDDYFIAHHGVYKGPKLRVVFDAAARFRGKCLNDSILRGPALQTPLPSVITRFREGEIAWAADVEAMFSRIRLRQSDARYFRFLWQRKEDTSPVVCEMRRLPFGATCSPFIAIHTTRRAAVDYGASEAALDAILNKTYVDDYLSSARTLRDGVQEAVAVKEALAHGDMHLQGWISNSEEFLQAIEVPASSTTNAESLAITDDDTEKVLGIFWRPQSDTFGFHVGDRDVTYTHVGLLSQLASVFDPLGAAAPLTIKGKVSLRRLSIKGLLWSDPVEGEDRRWWEQWFRTLRQLNDFRFPRCLFPSEDRIATIELHTFGDASEEAYAAVTYVRNKYQDGRVIVRQVKAVTKLAPKKVLSVPKLELNAAVLSARLARSVGESITRKIDRRFFWTDSSTVRNWIRASATFYQTFVSNRIGEIQSLTEANEWRFVPGKLNTADAATRSAFAEPAIPPDWFTGPDFLNEVEELWPKDLPWMAVTDEIKPVRVFNTVVPPPFDWSAVTISPEDIPALTRFEPPFFELIKRCQEEVYSEEIHRLKKKKLLNHSSSLLACSPFLGEDGLLRLGNRAKRARLRFDRLHQPILPNDHPLSRQIILAFHQNLRHAGTELLFSYLQHYFWIVGGREAVKKVRRECPTCRQERAKPGEQMMGDLPESRLEFGTTPFRNTAIDLFGPMEVGLPRNRTAKRWGVLFTCLVTRAVFNELVPSLSTDDFLLALRRFIGVYGTPHRIHSDNGTNFVGAERQLHQDQENLYASEAVAQFFKDKRIQWTFQPPRTPHFGGAHESLVRSTKRALYRALDYEKGKWKYPSEDLLRTYLFEVSGILNCRPLTYVSSDPTDFRPLCPNDFLNKPPVTDTPAGEFDDADPRECYRYLQRMLNLFWDLWKSGLLQSLATRKKWKSPRPNFAVGDVVMTLESGLSRGQWSIGHVVGTHPGADGLVRVVDVQLPTGIFRRGIHKLCLLEPISTEPSVSSNSVSGENVAAKT